MNNLRMLRNKRKLSQSALGDEFGVDKSQISRLESGGIKFHTEWIEKLCTFFNVSPTELLGSEETVQDFGLTTAKIEGYVQAGSFGEVNELPEDEQTLINVDAHYKNRKIYGLIVKGDSMDMEYEEGCVLHCLKFDIFEGVLNHGDHVIVIAVSEDGDKETTVKEYQVKDGKEYLVPRSSGYYQTYEIPHKEEDNVYINGKKIESISIEAIVVGHYYSNKKYY